MEDKTLNSEQSIELITRMIAQTRQKLERGGGTTFLVWGYTSFVVALTVYVTYELMGLRWAPWLWWCIPVLGWSLHYFTRHTRVQTVRTYVDKMISYVWIVTGAVALIYPTVGMFNWVAGAMIIPVESIILSMATILTGAFLAFRPLVVGGSIALALSFLMFWMPSYEVIFAAMFLVAMIIPGHILNYRARCSKN
ncbi:MAG: hypothetical protein RSF93_03225 [Mucinivorans sp.]